MYVCSKTALSKVAELKLDCPFILTAVVFIRAIAAVIVTVTHPHLRDTPVVVAGEVAGGTSGRDTSGTVYFIRTVAAVVHAVTAPTGIDAVLVVAGECIWRAGCSW